MAAAQFTNMVPDLSGQNSMKAMLIQKHLSELEQFNKARNEEIEEIDVDNSSSNDSGCEGWRKRSHTPELSSEDGSPYHKMARMIDVETVEEHSNSIRDNLAESVQKSEMNRDNSRNVFSIRNLIYSKDTSDSESAESEDSGNVNSSSGGSSPDQMPVQPWRPDPEMLHRLKAELVQSLGTFVDTIVSDVVAKVANDFSAIQPTKSKKKKSKRKQSNDSSGNDSMNSSQALPSEKSFNSQSYDAPKVITKFEPGTPVPSIQPMQTQQPRVSPIPAGLNTPFNPLSAHRPAVNPIRPAPHHQVALQQHAALNAVRQNPLFMQRENRAYPYSGYPYTAPVNALLQQQDYRRSFLHIDPITGRIKNDEDYDHSIFGGAPQEGLTPHHLKKAKLMFFYTRYPSSNVLKTYFPDVKFNRATTSQLIKWFSNFREFFYIQVEKYARQALSEGVTDPAELRVTRDCDMFKALNNHYNKTNEFEVPDEFLDCALASLREFFVNIKEGRDADPSWKKAIYKIICKSDTEIPESFKSATFLTDVAH